MLGALLFVFLLESLHFLTSSQVSALNECKFYMSRDLNVYTQLVKAYVNPESHDWPCADTRFLIG